VQSRLADKVVEVHVDEKEKERKIDLEGRGGEQIFIAFKRR
jgi:hypothetical protein